MRMGDRRRSSAGLSGGRSSPSPPRLLIFLTILAALINTITCSDLSPSPTSVPLHRRQTWVEPPPNGTPCGLACTSNICCGNLCIEAIYLCFGLPSPLILLERRTTTITPTLTITSTASAVGSGDTVTVFNTVTTTITTTLAADAQTATGTGPQRQSIPADIPLPTQAAHGYVPGDRKRRVLRRQIARSTVSTLWVTEYAGQTITRSAVVTPGGGGGKPAATTTIEHTVRATVTALPATIFNIDDAENVGKKNGGKGAIIGGVLGGVFGAAILVAGGLWYRRRRQKRMGTYRKHRRCDSRLPSSMLIRSDEDGGGLRGDDSPLSSAEFRKSHHEIVVAQEERDGIDDNEKLPDESTVRTSLIRATSTPRPCPSFSSSHTSFHGTPLIAPPPPRIIEPPHPPPPPTRTYSPPPQIEPPSPISSRLSWEGPLDALDALSPVSPMDSRMGSFQASGGGSRRERRHGSKGKGRHNSRGSIAQTLGLSHRVSLSQNVSLAHRGMQSLPRSVNSSIRAGGDGARVGGHLESQVHPSQQVSGGTGTSGGRGVAEPDGDGVARGVGAEGTMGAMEHGEDSGTRHHHQVGRAPSLSAVSNIHAFLVPNEKKTIQRKPVPTRSPPAV
ncbi:hypothetical protein EX30DRAFT_259280 [Ascodesmis nigricans]|uniref:Mid2 domain-containing protein n=1 Tax=Ascodesmis nigricans TaxID=341454 RepID=A0A4S2MXI7_9PEZI|nr:hypothetical protein EX30DRAFT_259280 [Ascodesmis nigricans]